MKIWKNISKFKMFLKQHIFILRIKSSKRNYNNINKKTLLDILNFIKKSTVFSITWVAHKYY